MKNKRDIFKAKLLRETHLKIKDVEYIVNRIPDNALDIAIDFYKNRGARDLIKFSNEVANLMR